MALNAALAESSSEAVDIGPLDPEHAQPWDDFHRTTPGATPFQTRAWQLACQDTLGHRAATLGAWRSGSLVGLLPLMRVKPPLSRASLVSVPASSSGGPLATEPAVADALVRFAVRQCDAEGLGKVEIRVARGPGDLGGLAPSGHFVSYQLDLDADVEKLWIRMPQKIRTAVRKARSCGLEPVIGRSQADLDGFVSVYQSTMDRLGSPGFGPEFFRALLDRFGDAAFVVRATHGGRTIAADFVLEGSGWVLPIYSGQELIGRDWKANYLVSWETIAHGAHRGDRVYDFGRSTAGTGAARFKSRWGTREVPLAHHVHVPGGGPVQELDPHRPIFVLASKVWRLMPRALRWWLGPRVVRYLH